MKVLVACEESQRVTSEFRRGGTAHILVILCLAASPITQSGTSCVMYLK